MLFIYGALQIGGIETFFVRMAKERYRKGLDTSILLLSVAEDSDKNLLDEMRKYSNVFFTEDLFVKLPFLGSRFPLLRTPKISKIKSMIDKVDQVHAFDGMHLLLGQRLLKIANKDIPITIGFYHYIKYAWGGASIAYNEKVNRDYIFNHLPRDSLLFFSKGNRDFYTKNREVDFSSSHTFRLGVVDKKNIVLDGKLNSPLTIVAVGRLVNFKSYNIFMLDVMRKLIDKGYDIRFDIYGYGTLQADIEHRVKELELEAYVRLNGTLDYHRFDEIVSRYDMFVGSGTAIIQAASLGVPSIVGVENMLEPKTYGYFSEVHQYEYNLKGQNILLKSIGEMIEEYITSDDQYRLELKKSHLDSIEEFTNESCQESMDLLKSLKMPDSDFDFNPWAYELSRILDKVNKKFNRFHPRNTEFDNLKDD